MGKQKRKLGIGILCAVCALVFFGTVTFVSTDGRAEAAINSSYTVSTVGNPSWSLNEQVTKGWNSEVVKNTTIQFTKSAYWAIKNGGISSISYAVHSTSAGTFPDPRYISFAGAESVRNDKAEATQTVTVSDKSAYSEDATNRKYSAAAWMKATSKLHDIDTTWKTLSITMNKSDTTAPTVSLSEGVWTASSSLTVQDKASGLWKYELKNTTTNTTKTGNWLSSGTTAKQSISLSSQGAYQLKVWDNCGNTVTRNFQYYNPTVKLSLYLDGASSTNSNVATLGIDGSSDNTVMSTSGKTVGDSYGFTAPGEEGYYFEKYEKNGGVSRSAVYTPTTTYTLAEGDAYTATLEWKTHFRTISTVDKTVTYSGKQQSVVSPTLQSGFSAVITYKGINGTVYTETPTAPSNAGVYEATVKVYRGATQTDTYLRGTKKVTLTIEKANAVLSDLNATELTYGQPLSASVLTANPVNPVDNTLTVAGNISWDSPSDIPTVVPAYSGAYTFTPDDTVNYNVLHNSIPLTVRQRIAVLDWSGGITHTYDGEIYSPAAELSNLVVVNGVTDVCTVTVDGRARDVGAHEAVASALSNGNYTLEGTVNLSQEYRIWAIEMADRELEIDRADWAWTYDGNTYTVTVETTLLYGDIAEVTYYIDDKEVTNAEFKNVKREGDATAAYRVRAVLTHKNYYEKTIAEKEVTISPADLKDEGFQLSGVEKTYDGDITSAVLSGQVTQYGDTVTAVYSIDGDESVSYVTHVKRDPTGVSDAVLNYAAKVALSHPNYIGCELTAEIRIEPKTVTLTYADVTAEYGVSPALAPIVTGLVDGDVLKSVSGMLTTRRYTVGTYNITPQEDTSVERIPNPDYFVSKKAWKLTIDPRKITVLSDNLQVIYGDDPDFTGFGYRTYKTGEDVSSVGILQGDNISVAPVYTRWQDYPVKAGGHEIYFAETAENPNYNITFAPGTLTVLPRPVTVTPDDVTIVYGDTPDTSKYTAYRTVGEGDGVMTGDSLRLTAQSGGSYPVIRLENGEYGAHEYAFGETIGANPNYTLTFEAGRITVTPRAVTVRVADAEADYGQTVPSFVITYENFASGESENSAGITAARAICDAAAYSDVGTYPVTLSQAAGNNYTFDCTDTAIFRIKPVKLPVLTYSDELDYYGQSYLQVLEKLELAGLSAGTQPAAGKSGVTIAYRKRPSAVTFRMSLRSVVDEDGFTLDPPTEAGEYDVKLTYHPAPDDNYAETEWVVPCGLVIRRIAPDMEIIPVEARYTSRPAVGMAVRFTVGNGCTAPEQEGGVTFEYFYDGAWQTVAPANKGSYAVRASYQPVSEEDGNYLPVSVETENVLAISPVQVSLYLEAKTVEYNDTVHSANVAVVEGVGTDRVSQTVSYTFNAEAKTVGAYDVTVSWVSDNENYLDTEYVFKNAVTVRPNTEDLYYVLNGSYSKIYDGLPIGASTVDGEARVPEGWEQPKGRVEYKFSRNGGVYMATVRDAGEYAVQATYIPAEGDQYAGKQMEFPAGTVSIRPAQVEFAWETQSFVYNAKPHAATVEVKGINGGTAPMGQVIVEYGQKDGTYSAQEPVHAGNYRLRVSYVAAQTDNYASVLNVIRGDVFSIEKAAPSITIRYFTEDYTGREITFPSDRVSIGGIYGGETPNGRMEIRYHYEGGWQSVPPYRSGQYDIRVIYYAVDEAGEEGNYSDTDKVFTGALTIRNIAPIILLEDKVAQYNGAAVASNTPRINTDAYEGVLSVEYLMGSVWSTSAPSEAGVYDIRVTYRAAENDSYRSAVKEFPRALIIKEMELTVVPFSGQFKEYDGLPHNPIGFTVKNAEGRDVGLPEGDVTGALSAGTNPNAGSYPITLGTLQAGRNYILTMADNTQFYRIDKKTVVVRFGEIDPMYDGTDKTVNAEVSGVLAGESVTMRVTYSGDRRNVGTFTAIATVESDNYVLSGGEKEFTIAPALITGVSMHDVVAVYDGKPHTVEATGAEGCELIYETANSFTEVGGYVVRVRVEKPNHVTRTLEATVTVLKGKQNFTVQKPSEVLRYGDDLPTLYAGEDGVAVLDQGQELKPGTAMYAYTYTPKDTAHYETQHGFIELTVEKKAPTLGIEGDLVQSTQNPGKINGTVDIPMENVEIYYESEDGSRFTQMPTEEGKYRVVVSYKGNDLYEAGEYVTMLVIQKPVNYTWVLILVGVLIALGLISVVVVSVRRSH